MLSIKLQYKCLILRESDKLPELAVLKVCSDFLYNVLQDSIGQFHHSICPSRILYSGRSQFTIACCSSSDETKYFKERIRMQ